MLLVLTFLHWYTILFLCAISRTTDKQAQNNKRWKLLTGISADNRNSARAQQNEVKGDVMARIKKKNGYVEPTRPSVLIYLLLAYRSSV